MRISRPCYDKPHRCPGWAGGGMRSAKVDRCEGGSIRVHKFDKMGYWGYPGEFAWHFGHCNKCDVVTWPVVTRWLSPRDWWWSVILWRKKWDIENWLYDRGWSWVK